jgi:hypothetical protein
MTLRRRKAAAHEPCYRCGRPVDPAKPETVFLLTRIDPHTRIQRPLSADEAADIKRRKREDPTLRLWDLGYFLSTVCEECHADA